jgi:hypothetical protein
MGIQQDLPIETKTSANGKSYNTVTLLPKPKKGIAGLQPTNFVLYRKLFAEGKQFKKDWVNPNGKTTTSFNYLCNCTDTKSGTDLSFFLNQKQHDNFKVCGGIGDTIRITRINAERPDYQTGGQKLVPDLQFEKV